MLHLACTTTDMTLERDAARSSPVSATELVRTHQASVFSVAYATLADRGLAEQIAQETFVTAWLKLGAGEEIRDVPAWLRGIARHLAHNQLRRRRHEEDDRALADAPAPGPSALDGLLDREARVIVQRSLGAMPEKYREPLVHFYMVGQSVKEVADALAISEDAVKQRLTRGRRYLQAGAAELLEEALPTQRPNAAFTAVVIAAMLSAAGAARAAPLGKPAAAWSMGTITAGIVLALGTAATAWLAFSPPSRTPAPTLPPASSSPAATAGATTKPPKSAATKATRPHRPESATLQAHLTPRLDLDLDQAEIGAVLRILSDASGVLMVVKGDISSAISVHMKGATLDEILDEVLLQAGAERIEVPALRLVRRSPAPARPTLAEVPIDLQLSDAPIVDVTRQLQAALGVLVVVDPSVADTKVSYAGKHVPAGEVFEQILSRNGLVAESTPAFEIRPDLPAAR